MAAPASAPGRLRTGSLSIWEAIGISVALMAPSMAANINPQGTVGLVGRAVPLAFVFATVGVLLISYGIVRLCQYYNHAGSVFGFVGVTLGPRTGVLAGWTLIGTYVFYACVTSAAAGIFGADFLDRIGVWNNPPGWGQFLIAFIALGGAFLLATFPARSATRLLLSLEGITVLLIIIVAIVVLAKVISGDTPGNQSFTLDVFKPTGGVGIGDVFKASVFGFLSFAGFEAAATLGEETRDPRRSIPRAILGVAVFGGIYFIFVTAVEMMGFGTEPRRRCRVRLVRLAARRPRFRLRHVLARRHRHGRNRDQRLRLRDRVRRRGDAHPVRAQPRRARHAGSRHRPREDGNAGAGAHGRHGRRGDHHPRLPRAVHHEPVQRVPLVGRDRHADPARRLHPGDARRDPAAVVQRPGEVADLAGIIPGAALIVLLATIYYNVDPDAARAFRWTYYTAGIWVILGIVLVVALPGLSRRVGERLSADDGLVTPELASEAEYTAHTAGN